MSDISNQTNFLRTFEAAIVLPFAKNRANPRKVWRNFERHFADSSKFSQLNSKRASKFRRLFQTVLKKIGRLLRNIEVLVTRRSWLLRYSLLKCNPLLRSYGNLLHSPRKVTAAFKWENTLFLKAQFVIKITTVCPVLLGNVLHAKLYVLANIRR